MKITAKQSFASIAAANKQECLKVTFEAFGQTHIAYASKYTDDKTLEHIVSKIAPTARITELCTDLADKKTISDDSIYNIENWHNQILKNYGDEQA